MHAALQRQAPSTTRIGPWPSLPSFAPVCRRCHAFPGASMPGYTTRDVTVCLGGHDYHIRALSDLQQFADPHGAAERARHFLVAVEPVRAGVAVRSRAGRGDEHASTSPASASSNSAAAWACRAWCCSAVSPTSPPATTIRWPSLSCAQRHAERAAGHRLSRPAAGRCPMTTLGSFDLIIGSDILYERGHAALLAAMILRHAQPSAEVLITDPGRGNSASVHACACRRATP